MAHFPHGFTVTVTVDFVPFSRLHVRQGERDIYANVKMEFFKIYTLAEVFKNDSFQ